MSEEGVKFKSSFGSVDKVEPLVRSVDSRGTVCPDASSLPVSNRGIDLSFSGCSVGEILGISILSRRKIPSSSEAEACDIRELSFFGSEDLRAVRTADKPPLRTFRILVCADLFNVPFMGIRGGISSVGGGTSAANGGNISSVSTPSPEIGRPDRSKAPSFIRDSSFSSSATVIIGRSAAPAESLLDFCSSFLCPSSEYLEYVSSSEGSICLDSIDLALDKPRCECAPLIDLTRLIVPVDLVSSTRR